MHQNTRIELNDTTRIILMKLSDGDAGALTVLDQILKRSMDIDPDARMGGLDIILSLDSQGIYGRDIWKLYRFVAAGSMFNFFACLLAVHFELLDETNLLRAIKDSGEANPTSTINCDELVTAVRKVFPNFATRSDGSDLISEN